jgi:hypothetical protein
MINVVQIRNGKLQQFARLKSKLGMFCSQRNDITEYFLTNVETTKCFQKRNVSFQIYLMTDTKMNNSPYWT